MISSIYKIELSKICLTFNFLDGVLQLQMLRIRIYHQINNTLLPEVYHARSVLLIYRSSMMTTQENWKRTRMMVGLKLSIPSKTRTTIMSLIWMMMQMAYKLSTELKITIRLLQVLEVESLT